MTLAALARLRALCDAASVPPWEVYSEPEVGLLPMLMARQGYVRTPLEPLRAYNLEFIAAARGRADAPR